MVKRIVCADLEPCGCREWQWAANEQVEEPGEGYDGDIMRWLEDNVLDWEGVEITDEYNGAIHNLRDGVILAMDGDPRWMYWAEETPAMLSLNNANTWLSGDELMPEDIADHWQAITQVMDPEIRETVHRELAPCEPVDFLRRYLELATYDLCI